MVAAMYERVFSSFTTAEREYKNNRKNYIFSEYFQKTGYKNKLLTSKS